MVTKEVAYAAAVPRSFYDDMAATGSSIGVYLRDQQKQSLRKLWAGIHQGHLPPKLTSEWFFRTFTNLDVDSPDGRTALSYADSDPDDFEFVWRQVSKFNLYDPPALLAAVPGVSERLFRADAVPGTRGEVAIVGAESVRDPQRVTDLISGLAVRGLAPDSSAE